MLIITKSSVKNAYRVGGKDGIFFLEDSIRVKEGLEVPNKYYDRNKKEWIDNKVIFSGYDEKLLVKNMLIKYRKHLA